MSKPNQYLNHLFDKYLSYLIAENTEVLFIDSQFSQYKNLSNSRKLIFNSTHDGVKLKKIDCSPDYIVLDGNFHYSRDIQVLLDEIREITKPSTRVIALSYNYLWTPLFRLGTVLNLRKKTAEMNWLSSVDLNNLYTLTGFSLITSLHKILWPFQWFFIGDFINRFLLPLPWIENLSMIRIDVLRISSSFIDTPDQKSVSFVIPVRNEEGMIEKIVKELPQFTSLDQLIFVEGGSTDNTWSKVQQIQKKYLDQKNIIIMQQTGKGKGNAVREGFAKATNNIFMIYDADMTVPAADMVKFHKALTAGLGELINGSRLVYPMENKAMQFLNMLANKFFARSFSFVLGQQLKDTLCGTKVLTKANYERIIKGRSYFGPDDPFGDFDLLFGASKNNFKIIELPITYRERTYGTTNISRWSHGWMLLKMLVKATFKMKCI